MNKKLIGGALCLGVVGIATGGALLVSRRQFLNNFNAGFQALAIGNSESAKRYLEKALRSKPSSQPTRELLIKVFTEEALHYYDHQNIAQATEDVDHALALAADGPLPTLEALMRLKNQFLAPRKTGVQSVAELLRQLPISSRKDVASEPVDVILKQWLEEAREEQRGWKVSLESRDRQWSDQLRAEKETFWRILCAGIFLVSLGGFTFLGLLAFLLKHYFGRKGRVVLLLQRYEQLALAVSPPVERLKLESPDLRPPEHTNEKTAQIHAIEAELADSTDKERAQKQLQSFLEGEDPWVRARAAKALYKWDPATALKEVKELLKPSQSHMALPGIWALGELASGDSLDVLAPLVWSEFREVQQAAIRCLVQMQAKQNLPQDVKTKVLKLLEEVRQKTQWMV